MNWSRRSRWSLRDQYRNRRLDLAFLARKVKVDDVGERRPPVPANLAQDHDDGLKRLKIIVRSGLHLRAPSGARRDVVFQRAVDVRQPEAGRYRERPLVGGRIGLRLRGGRGDRDSYRGQQNHSRRNTLPAGHQVHPMTPCTCHTKPYLRADKIVAAPQCRQDGYAKVESCAEAEDDRHLTLLLPLRCWSRTHRIPSPDRPAPQRGPRKTHQKLNFVENWMRLSCPVWPPWSSSLPQRNSPPTMMFFAG
jgi:hypothetical protein